ncbi:MAG: hypothetical protein WBC05_25160 [Sedimentisphaerales bacterium]
MKLVSHVLRTGDKQRSAGEYHGPNQQRRFFLGPANVGGPQRLNVESLPELPVGGIGAFLLGLGVVFFLLPVTRSIDSGLAIE